MSLSILEMLPNEILMLIFQYSGDAPNILQAFLGLNQRFNNILLGRQLHLLTNYLSLKALNEHYNSNEFQQAKSQLLSVKTSINEEKLVEILRPLIGYGIRQRYIEVAANFRLSREKFESVRRNLSENQLLQVDHEIKKEFSQFMNELLEVDHEIRNEFSQFKDKLAVIKERLMIKAMKRMKELVLTRGARLECRNDRGVLNLALFVKKCYLPYSIRYDERKLKLHMKLDSQIIQVLVISNPALLDNLGEFLKSSGQIEYFLFYYLFGSRIDWFYEAENGQHNRIILDLLFLIFYNRSTTIDEEERLVTAMLERLNETKTVLNHFYIRAVQAEMVKFTFEQCNRVTISLDEPKNRIVVLLKNLIGEKRLDIIEYLFHEPLLKDLCQKEVYIRRWINIMIGTSKGRQALDAIMNYPTLKSLFSQKDLLFILLNRQERSYLEKLLTISPNLINELDDEGNDPLLYITLHNSSHRHRIIEMLIKYGCDPKRKNIHGQTFQDALHLPQNQELLDTLIEYKIIDKPKS